MNDDIAEAAESMVGTPFVHEGRVAGVGLDCVGLVHAACMQAGSAVQDFRGYDRMPDPRVLDSEMAARFRRIPPESARRGDIVVIGGKSSARHVGILISPDRMVEARGGREVCVSAAPHTMIVSAFRVR